MKQDGGPTAIETHLGWVLSGPAKGLHQKTVINLISTHSSHMLRVDSITEPESLDAGLKRFWELESLGILKEEHPVQQQFSQRISFKGEDTKSTCPGRAHTLPYPTTMTCVESNWVAYSIGCVRIQRSFNSTMQSSRINFTRAWWRLLANLPGGRERGFTTSLIMGYFVTISRQPSSVWCTTLHPRQMAPSLNEHLYTLVPTLGRISSRFF